MKDDFDPVAYSNAMLEMLERQLRTGKLMPPKPKLRVIDFEAEREKDQERIAKAKRRGLFAAARRMVDVMGAELGGYAIIVWDQDGAAASAICPGAPISRGYLPSFAQLKLTEHHVIGLVSDNVHTTPIFDK